MAPPRDYVLAVDVGTSAVRVSAVSLTGEALATEREPSRPTIEGDRAEIDAEALWADVAAVIRRSRDVVGAIEPGRGRLMGLGVACQVGLVFVDGHLAPIGPALGWQDRRATAEADDLGSKLGGRARELAGRVVTPELTAPRVRWLASHDPDAWRRTRWVLSLKDFLVARLTGQVVTDATSASYSLLFDVRERSWSAELAAAAEMSLERLPAVVGAAEDGVGLSEEAASALGLPDGLPVAVGGPDGTVASLGAGAIGAGRTVDVAGSTDVLVRVVDRPLADQSGRCVLNAFLLPGLWTVGGPTGLTGGAIGWLAGVLGYPSVGEAYRALGAAASGLPPGAGGVSFRTALSGERFPTWAGGDGGAILGLRPDHGPAHLLRAAEEGAAFALREGLAAVEALGLDTTEVRICGGVARQPSAMELRANAWQRRVVGVANPEASTIGAAMLAAVRAGAFASAAEAEAAMIRLDPPIDPEPASGAAWGAAYRRWQSSRGPSGERSHR